MTWLVAVVVNAMDDLLWRNHTCLVLTGEQGKFKTTFLDLLCPEELKSYLFTGKIDPQGKDVQTLIAEYLLFFILYTRIFTIFANYQMIFMESPTNRIKEVLIEKGIKQTWLAEKLGKSFTIVNSYVCNRRQPSLELLFQIAEILQVNPKELIVVDKKLSKEQLK